MTEKTPIELVEKAIREIRRKSDVMEVAPQIYDRAVALSDVIPNLTLIRDALKDAEKEIMNDPIRMDGWENDNIVWVSRRRVLKALGCGEKEK